MTEGYQERTYRQLVQGHLSSLRVTVQETDLSVYANGIEPDPVREVIIEQRGYIEGYIQRHPRFLTHMQPWPDDPLAPPIVQDMIRAGKAAGVGPMAAVAGAVAERVGRFLLGHTDEVIVENGGDIFLDVGSQVVIGIFAGESPLSMKFGLIIEPARTPLSVCTSSGTIGHSKSFGNADAVCVVSPSCSLSDAAATAVANRIKNPNDIGSAMAWGQSIAGVIGLLAISGDKMGLWGKVELNQLQ